MTARRVLLAAVASCALCAGTAAQAAGADALSDAQLRAVEAQIQALKAELRHVRQQAAQRDRQVQDARRSAVRATPPAATQLQPIVPQIPAGYALVPASPGAAPGAVVLARVEPPRQKPAKIGTFQVGDATITLGGFIAADSVFRSRNSAEDVQTNFTTGVPERYQPQYHESEFRESARLTRITGLAEQEPDEQTRLRAYVSVDFQGASPTSNYNESNSWLPRLREAWASYDDNALGVQVLAGQAWSLLTMTRIGMDPLNVNSPQTVDPTSAPGFAYARQAQLRVMKSFAGGQYRVAVSFENPATIYAGTATPSTLGTVNFSNPGVGIDAIGSNATTPVVSTVTTVGGKSTVTTTNVLTPGNITDDIVPDVIVKATADYDVAHLEAFGLGRVFHDRLSRLGTGQSNTLFGGGAGGSALIRVLPKYLEFQVTGLAGRGIGRYDPTNLPDATLGRGGQPVSLPGWDALVGLVGHPVRSTDIYAYLGTDNVSARSYSATSAGKVTGYGYGNPLYDNAGCQIELSPASTCAANTSGVAFGTIGAWYRFFKGQYGTMQVGAQYSYVRRFVFQGFGPTPVTDNNSVFLSFRYFPFQ